MAFFNHEHTLYESLARYVMKEWERTSHGYPRQDPQNPTRLEIPFALRAKIASQLLAPYKEFTCRWCKKDFRISRDEGDAPSDGECAYHRRPLLGYKQIYPCCNGGPRAPPCQGNWCHVHWGAHEPETYENYVETKAKPEREPNGHGIYALDCEMCNTTHGFELTKITLLNYKSDLVYEKLVKPKNRVLNYNTKFSGIRESDMIGVSTRLEDVQRDLLVLFSDKTILIGHGLDSDLRALKLFHNCVIDTAHLYPNNRGVNYKYSLKQLADRELNIKIQQDSHDSREDARIALLLVLKKHQANVRMEQFLASRL